MPIAGRYGDLLIKLERRTLGDDSMFAGRTVKLPLTSNRNLHRLAVDGESRTRSIGVGPIKRQRRVGVGVDRVQHGGDSRGYDQEAAHAGINQPTACLPSSGGLRRFSRRLARPCLMSADQVIPVVGGLRLRRSF